MPTSSQIAPAGVPGNDWTLLEAPTRDDAEPELSVVVVIEGGDDAARGLTASALAAQSYPDSLVSVAGPEGGEPEADVVVLVEAGTIPAAGLVGAHARWHGAASDVVTLGPAPPVDAEGMDGTALATAPPETLEARRLPGDDPFELVCDLTRQLTDPQHGVLLGATLGTLGVRRETLLAAGGLRGADAGSRALHRLDLALRLWCFGVLFVPEPGARAWASAGAQHAELGRAIALAAVERRTLELEYPELASAIPLPPLRPTTSPRRYRRPAVVVNVDADGESGADVLAAIGPILNGRFGDLQLRVQVEPNHPDHAQIEAAVAHDPRAGLAPPSTVGFCDSPFQVTVPAVTWPDARTLQDLYRLLVAEGVGSLHVTVPGAPPEEAMIEAVTSNALARSTRVAAASGEPVEVTVGRLFGERWHSGVEVSVRRHGVEEPHVTEHGPLSAATDPEHERVQHLRFRARADDMERQARVQAGRVLVERLRARRERQRAEELEAKLHRVRGEP